MSSENPVARADKPRDRGMDYVVQFSGVNKYYQIYDKPHYRLLQGLLGGRKQYFRKFRALQDISFRIRKGETLGIIGRNGAGKSTILQILCGTLAPSSGTVAINGKITALLELGAGFNPEFTGRENVYMNASIFGLSNEETDACFDAIAAFADIGEFIDQPVKTYSSGMTVRLAFSVITHVGADILVIDEALAVGDVYFTQKCMRYLEDFRRTGTLLFVSHDMGAVQSLCDSCIWIDQGMIRATGNVKDITERYLESCYDERAKDFDRRAPETVSGGDDGNPVAGKKSRIRSTRSWIRDCRIHLSKFDPQSPGFGEGGARIVDAAFVDANGQILSTLTGSSDVVFQVRAEIFEHMSSPAVGFIVKNRHGKIVYDLSTYYPLEDQHVQFEPGSEVLVNFRYKMPVLAIGEYLLSVAIAEGGAFDHIQLHWLHDVIILTVTDGPFMQGDMWVHDPEIEVILINP